MRILLYGFILVFAVIKTYGQENITYCNADYLLKQNNISLYDKNNSELSRKVKNINNSIYSGSFSEKGKKQCFLYSKITGDFCNAEDNGIDIFIVFEEDGSQPKRFQTGAIHSKLEIKDYDKDGISEVSFQEGSCHGGACYSEFKIFHGLPESENKIFEINLQDYNTKQLFEQTANEDIIVDEMKYSIVGNRIILNHKCIYQDKRMTTYTYENRLKYWREVSKEAYFEIKGKKVVYLSGIYDKNNLFFNSQTSEEKIELNVEFDEKNLLLIKAKRVNISGKISTSDGQLLRNEIIGLDDGLRKMCTTLSTDSEGRFSFSCTPSFIGTGVLAFYSKDNSICYKSIPIIESNTNSKISSLPCQSISIKNESNTDLKVKLTVNMSNTDESVKYVNLPANKTTEVVKLKQPVSFPFKFCAFSGLQATIAFIAGGDASVTLDCEGKSTVSISGGVALVRGTIYWLPKNTSEIGGGGVCWSPGGDIGVTPSSASGEVSLCLGTDGLSISGSIAPSAVVGGIQLQIIEFK